MAVSWFLPYNTEFGKNEQFNSEQNPGNLVPGINILNESV